MSGLVLRGVGAGYGPMRVLEEIDLEVAVGERVGLVGLNGHGKTTLLRAVMGMAGWCDGERSWRGRSIARTAPHELARRGLILMPQGDALFPGLSVRDNLESGAYLPAAWRRRAARRRRVLDLFPKLVPHLDQPAGTLSGGERRMLSVGRGLMADGELYLVDEPSLGLAPGIATGLVRALMSLELENGAMVIAEQNRSLLGGVDRIVRLHAGRVAEELPATAAAAEGR